MVNDSHIEAKLFIMIIKCYPLSCLIVGCSILFSSFFRCFFLIIISNTFPFFHLQGSILVTFDIQGDLTGTQDALSQDVSNGIIILTFDGNTLVPSSILLPGGEEVINPDQVM